MIYVVKELPEHVKLSPRLREQASVYLCVESLGVDYYIAATPKVRRLLCLDKHGHDAKPDMRRSWRTYDKADALRDIINSLELQVRDVELAGIEENVKEALLDRMDALMTPTVRGAIKGEQLLLEAKRNESDHN